MSEQRPTARDGYVRGHRPRASRARRSLGILLGLGLLAVVGVVQFGDNGIVAFADLRNRERELRSEVADLEARNQALAEQIEAVATDPETLERIAREKHNMRRPDEEVLVVLPVEPE